MVGATGFEPTAFWSRTKRATKLRYAPSGANEGTRTLDPRITNALLYQLSHIGLASMDYSTKMLFCHYYFENISDRDSTLE